MITPELARLQSNENAWKRLSIYCKKGMQWAIDKGLTQVKLNYNNRYYEYFYNDIKILRSIGFSYEFVEGGYEKYDIDTIKPVETYLIIYW